MPGLAGRRVVRKPRVVVLLAVLTAAFAVLAGRALGDSVSDPQGDNVPCVGECSMYDQDLKEVTPSLSGGQVSFTIEQYGSFSGPTVCRCYFPQVHIFFNSTNPAAPDYYTAAWNGGPYPYPIGLFQTSVSQADPCPFVSPGHGGGGAYGVGKVADVTVTPNGPDSVTYTFPASALPSTSFRYRVVEPAASRCQTQGNPETSPIDAAPDSGFANFGGGPPARVELVDGKLMLGRKALTEKVGCPAPCATVKGTGNVKALGHKYKLVQDSSPVSNGKASLHLKLKPAAAHAVQEALDRNRAVVATLNLAGKDASGNVVGTKHERRSFH